MKYILTHWKHNEGNEYRNLRPITRENKRYLLSDTQRYVRSWDEKPVRYCYIYKWAAKFLKDDSKLGFRRSVSRNHNTDGVMEYTVTKDPSTLKCPYTFDELFNVDYRDIQDPEDWPLKSILREVKSMEKKGKIVNEDYKQYLADEGEEGAWDKPLIDKLKKLFKVSQVKSTSFMKIDEHRKQTKISKSGTLFHYTFFNKDKKYITSEQNYFNRTIVFWLFDDLLVFQYEDGKTSW